MRRGRRRGSVSGSAVGEAYGRRPLGGSGGSSSGIGAANGGMPQGEVSGSPLARSSVGPGGEWLILGSAGACGSDVLPERGSSSSGGRRGGSLGPEATRRTS